MTTETAPELEVAEPTSDQANGSAAPAEEAAPLALEEPPEPKITRFGDPRRAVVDVLRDRLERVLQPVDVDDVWHGVNVITAKDLELVTAEDLPPASIFAASVRTPAFIYVDAVCPVCGIAGEITVELEAKLTATRNGRKLALGAKATALPHQCGQLRIRDVGPNRPAKGQTAAFEEGGDVEPEEPETLADLEQDQVPPLPSESIDSDDGTSSQDDDVDLRPSGEVNPAELQGAARHDVDEAERATDGDDLLPF